MHSILPYLILAVSIVPFAACSSGSSASVDVTGGGDTGGDAFFNSPTLVSSEGFANSAVGDFNNDGFEDLVVTYDGSGDSAPWTGVAIKVYIQNSSTGTLEDKTSTVISGTVPTIALARWIEVADFNGDGYDDIYFGNHGLEKSAATASTWYELDAYLLSNGDGTYTNRMSTHIPTFTRSDTVVGQEFYTHGVDSIDIDGDSDIDLVINMLWGPGVVILENNGSGSFTDVSATTLPGSLSTADLWVHFVNANSGNNPDLFVGDNTATEHRVYLNDGDGTFDTSSNQLPATLLNGMIEAAHTADINSDGAPDLIIGNTSSDFNTHEIQILISGGDGTFTDETSTRHPDPATHSGPNGNPFFFVRDLDNDGDKDILIVKGNGTSNTTGVFLNDGGVFKRVTTLTTLPVTFTPIDIGNDNIIDVVASGSVEVSDGTWISGMILYRSKDVLTVQ